MEDDYVFIGNSKRIWQRIPKDYIKETNNDS